MNKKRLTRKGSDNMQQHYKPKEFAKLLNVSVQTLQNWDRKGIFKAYRTPTDRRYYTHDQYLAYINEGKKAGDQHAN